LLRTVLAEHQSIVGAAVLSGTRVAAEAPAPAVDLRDTVLGRVESLPILDPRGFWDLIKRR
jgi:hypothetical protein